MKQIQEAWLLLAEPSSNSHSLVQVWKSNQVCLLPPSSCLEQECIVAIHLDFNGVQVLHIDTTEVGMQAWEVY